MFCLQPKGGLDFAAELAAKIGVAPVKKPDSDHDGDNDDKVADGEWSDEEHQVLQTAEVQEKQLSETKRRSDSSKSKEKKSHHHHHHHHDNKDRSESHGERKHRKRHNSKTSHSSVDTRQSVPPEDGEKPSCCTLFLLWVFLMFNFDLIIFQFFFTGNVNGLERRKNFYFILIELLIE